MLNKQKSSLPIFLTVVDFRAACRQLGLAVALSVYPYLKQQERGYNTFFLTKIFILLSLDFCSNKESKKTSSKHLPLRHYY